MTGALAVVCWSRIRRGHANLECRFSTRGFALIRPIPGSTDPAHRLPFPSSTNYRLELRVGEVRAEGRAGNVGNRSDRGTRTGGYSSTNSSRGTPYALAIFVTVGM